MNKKIKSFREQLKRAFIVVIVIPVLSLGSFMFYSSFRFIENQILSESMNLIKQSSIDMENRIKVCDDSLRYLVANYDLRDFLLINREDYLDLSKASKNIRELLYNVLMVNRYYKSLTIYTDKEFFVLTDFLKDSKQVENEEWYKNIVKSEGSYWWYEDDKVFLGKTIMAAYPPSPIGVIKVELKNDVFLDSFLIFKDIPIKIEIKDSEEVFYEYMDSGWNGNPRLKKDDKFETNGWSITYQIDKNYYDNYMNISLVTPILVIFMVLILSWFLIYYYSNRLAKGLSVLVEQIEEVQKGNLDISIKLSETTEINILATSIQNLLNKIKQLIREVYSKEIERQNLELNLLQSKMNPHFLYNNLSAINWIALENGQEKIYIIATELANFYRTALNRGKNIDKLSIELENIKAYIRLQLISHENSFNVKYHIDESALNKEVPLFILQPLVENAIEHGIDQLWDEAGKIEIIIERDEEWLLMKVHDNGTALYEKIGTAELPEEKFGYATSNVQKRIRLLYGDEGGLKILADKSGTTAIVRVRIEDLKKLM
ncbi:histidine kinase [Clostridium sp. D53t1_180928_C8]|uniref:sensor histidine kinase n=1 Tax=Clostridium sp. D53t1_180928_C8 TaxID=2787101 RepID=UPI0018AAFC05|nr:histidine kinase [Clostridium sp. D53t1_180928_C8]